MKNPFVVTCVCVCVDVCMCECVGVRMGGCCRNKSVYVGRGYKKSTVIISLFGNCHISGASFTLCCDALHRS